MTAPCIYTGASYARYEKRGRLQVICTVLIPENRIMWRVTEAFP